MGPEKVITKPAWKVSGPLRECATVTVCKSTGLQTCAVESEVILWLRRHGISFDAAVRNCDFKSWLRWRSSKKWFIEFTSHSHLALRLRPYSCDLKLTWRIVAAEYSINRLRELRLELVLLLRRTGKVTATMPVRALEGDHFQKDSLVPEVIV
jgi:hypothetical protein